MLSLAACASTPAGEGAAGVQEVKSPAADSAASGGPINATVMITGVAGSEAISPSAASMVDAWVCEAAERYGKRAEVRCKDDIDAVLQVRAMQASFASESGEDVDTEKLAELMRASHFLAVTVDQAPQGLLVQVLLATSDGQPMHRFTKTAVNLEAIEALVRTAVDESFAILAKAEGSD